MKLLDESAYTLTKMPITSIKNYPDGIIREEEVFTEIEHYFEVNEIKYALCYNLSHKEFIGKNIEDYLFQEFWIHFKKGKPKYLDLRKHSTLENVPYFFKQM